MTDQLRSTWLSLANFGLRGLYCYPLPAMPPRVALCYSGGIRRRKVAS